MINKRSYSKQQLIYLLIFRFVIGWHILYEGMTKVLNPEWTSYGFLQESQGIMSRISSWIMSNPQVLGTVDFLNAWGLVAIGLAVISGFLFKQATIVGAILIFIYYSNTPPLIGFEYTMPTDGNNLIINRVLIESIALLGLALFPTNKIFGLDFFIQPLLKRARRNGRTK